jgi:hypothetical protein
MPEPTRIPGDAPAAVARRPDRRHVGASGGCGEGNPVTIRLAAAGGGGLFASDASSGFDGEAPPWRAGGGFGLARTRGAVKVP